MNSGFQRDVRAAVLRRSLEAGVSRAAVQQVHIEHLVCLITAVSAVHSESGETCRLSI